MSFKAALNRFYLMNLVINRNNQTIKPLIYKTTNFRLFSMKPKSTDFNIINAKKLSDLEKELITKVMVKDESGKILGVKTKLEANQLAKKMSMFLIEEKSNEEIHKYPVFKLVSTKQMAKLEDNNGKSDDNLQKTDEQDLKGTKNVKKEIKRLAFSAKTDENDLMTKIKQIKRWVSKGFETNITVNSPQNDKKHLENIYQRFEQEFKGMVKFRQKRISENSLKFSVVSLVESKDQIVSEETDIKSDDNSIDFDNLDPNKLLSNEFEEELNKK